MDWNWKDWIKAAGIRAIKTLAQTAIATIGTSMALAQVDWALVVSASVLAAIISLLTSLAGLPELKTETGAHSIEPKDAQDD